MDGRPTPKIEEPHPLRAMRLGLRDEKIFGFRDDIIRVVGAAGVVTILYGEAQ
jgi:hypothetical protein